MDNKIREAFDKHFIYTVDYKGSELDYTQEEKEEIKKNWFTGFESGYKAAQPQWIPVEERLPDEIEGVTGILIGRNVGAVCAMTGVCFDGDFYVVGIGGTIKARGITHWMPLPTPPEVESK